MNANKSCKRNALSIADKLKILKKFDSRGRSETLKNVADSLKIPKTTLQTIVKNREKIEASAVNSNVMRKKSKCAKYEDMEEILIEWIGQARHGNIPLSGPIIQQKALEIMQSFKIEDFTASTGWLNRFNKRYGIVYKQICGESESVNEEDVNVWLNNILPNYLKRYDPKNIFNVDEFGLFYKLTPNKSFTLKHEKCHGGKLSKERITVLVGSNMDGSDKLKLLVIGKAANPRCFKNINKRQLLCDYENQNKAWMTGERFKKWLTSLDQKMQNKNRKILLFVDNCPAHPKNLNLKNIEIAFFPKNATSKLQPMDQGVIKVIKQFYRKRLVMRYLKTIDNSESEKPITILDAINYVSSSWDAIQQTTISNCFRKAGFNLDNNVSTEIYIFMFNKIIHYLSTFLIFIRFLCVSRPTMQK